MSEMKRVRARAQERSREERTSQLDLLFPDEAPESGYYRSLRERYLGRAMRAVLDLLRRRRRIAYDAAWERAMAWPLVWESDLKDWIHGWEREGTLRLEGLSERQRVPQLGRSHHLVFQPRADR
jgi:hypothetical protein